MVDFKRSVALASCFLLILLCGVVFAADANVAGTWTVLAKNGRRSVTQTLVLQQDGSKVTGTFKGPRQSGTIDGTVSGAAIKFHVTAKMPLDYTGTVNGDTMKGTLSSEGKTGDWTGTRPH
ncbi:MAG TPA: hypothetical protein VMB18_10070 [Terriglobales bacterium]|nr:hypothetical protein [Terriglobales bacterium]